MKKIIVYSTCLSILGCQTNVNPLTAISSNVVTSSGCGDKPTVSLSGKDVEAVALNENTITKSGQVSVNKHLGYTFTATTGQKLNYSTDADICLWVFTPDNEIIKGGELPKDGKYIIQVAAPQGVKTFDLKISLGSLETAESTPTPEYTSSVQPTPTPEYTPRVQSTPTPEYTNVRQNNTYESSSENKNLQPQHDISQEEALELVQRWYAAKPQIFGPPFDTSLVDQLATGKLHTFTTKPDGPVAWLEENDAYYKYNSSEIQRVIDFSNSGKLPYIKVRVSEELYLYGKRGIDRQNSGSYTNNFIYVFEKENGTWKIYDYRKVAR
ncbi:DUF4101 domain-containing protein [Sphaerospermopsis sp. LEGE 08334]|nr:DUF4101 domain-containing protein [Sphaerospermopsis sp. LEGE 08334]